MNVGDSINLFDAPLDHEKEIEKYDTLIDREFIKELRKKGFTAKRIVDILHSLDIVMPF